LYLYINYNYLFTAILQKTITITFNRDSINIVVSTNALNECHEQEETL